MNCLRVLVRSLSTGIPASGYKNVGIIGVPLEAGQKLGASVGTAPSKLRAAGLIEALHREGVNVEDYGDVIISTDVSESCKNVSEAVQNILKDNRLAITLGGDHSLGLGTVHAAHKHNNDVIVIWVDAHADINTRESSLSQNEHGMPLSMICKEFADHWKDAPHTTWINEPRFSVKNLAYIGLRSVDPYESTVIEKFNIPSWSMDLVDKVGAMSAAIRSIRFLDPNGVKPIHVSFDIDALDPVEAPSTILPVRGGLSYREAITIVETVAASGRLQSFDLVEIYPSKGDDKDLKKTLEVAVDLIKAAVGINRNGKISKRNSNMAPTNPLKPY